MNKSKSALTALQQKYPDGIPAVHSLTDEQKAWITMKIQEIAAVSRLPHPAKELSQIYKRLCGATEDIPDKELQKMVSFVFGNMKAVETLIKED